MKRPFQILLILSLWTGSCFASSSFEFPAQGRLFAGLTNANPQGLNQELKTQGLQEFSSIPKFGVEITYPLTSILNIGLNYTRTYLSKGGSDSNPLNSYQATLSQDSVLFVTRLALLKTNILRFDIFGGIGGSNTSLSLKSATQDGELTRRESKDWFASACARYGASAAVGYKNFFFVVEGGMDSNKVDSFKKSGNINDNIQSIDLSGGYVTVGLLFDGITAKSK